MKVVWQNPGKLVEPAGKQLAAFGIKTLPGARINATDPVTMTKTDGRYRVSTPGGVKARGTTKAKAQAQRRLLQGVEHGWRPTGTRRPR